MNTPRTIRRSTPERRKAREQFATPRVQHVAVQLGMWVFLATELMFFGPLFGSYVQGRLLHAEAFAIASRHTNVVAGTAKPSSC